MKKIYIKYLFVGLLTIFVFSCSNDNVDEVFSEAPANRLTQASTELMELLTAQEHGYKAVYFTKNDEFGGFTFFMNFNEDATVNMTSDFDEDTDMQSSSFDIRPGTATDLVFTTRNHIQKVSNPDYDGLRGTGFKGTSVFQFFSNQDGKLTFRDIRNADTGFLVLEPTGFSDFETESLASVDKSLAQRNNITPTATDAVFQILKIENASGEYNFNFNYDAFRQFASPRVEIYEGNIPTIQEFNFGLAFTEDGLIINPALEFEGETYETFTYNEETRSYVSTVNGTTATIFFNGTPAFLTSDVEALGEPGHSSFGYRITWGDSPLTSSGFHALMDDMNQRIQSSYGASAYFFQISYYAEPDDSGTVGMRIYFNIGGSFYSGLYLFKQTIADNKLYLEYLGQGNANAGYFANASEPLIEFFSSEEGLYFFDHGSFSTETTNSSNLSSSFTSISQPNLRLYGLWFN